MSCNAAARCAPAAARPDHYPHGGNIEAAAAAWQCDPADVLDLSTGLHPAGPPPWLAAWLAEHAALAGRYPDRDGEPAVGALAADFGVNHTQILITAGAQAAIETIFHALRRRTVAIRIPCYSEPIRCAERAGCEVRMYADGPPPAADLLWLTSPDNPSGAAQWPLPAGGAQRMICLDESYMPFAQRRRLGVAPHMIRIGSLTKTFCIPGLRLGYLIADAATIEQLRRWQPPWPAATQALHLLPQLLPEADARDAGIAAARARLQGLLAAAGWQVESSQASFLLARPPRGDMPDFASARILVRAFPEWPQLAGRIRFGFPGSEAGWQRLEQTLCRSR